MLNFLHWYSFTMSVILLLAYFAGRTVMKKSEKDSSTEINLLVIGYFLPLIAMFILEMFNVKFR